MNRLRELRGLKFLRSAAADGCAAGFVDCAVPADGPPTE